MAINVNGKVLRNLQEQVLENKQRIEDHYNIDRVLADFGIKVIGQVDSPDDLNGRVGENYGDAYAVGTQEPYEFYIWTRADPDGVATDHWFNVGKLAIIGPQGPVGPQGPIGPQGARGSIWSSGANTPSGGNYRVGDQYLQTGTGAVYIYTGTGWSLQGNIKGATGLQGNQGAQGPQGEQGPQGPKGDTGDVGGFINVAGIVPNTGVLPTPMALGDLTKAYLVGTAAPYKLYIQVGSTSAEAIWKDMGYMNVATYVRVNGEFQNVWDADTKLDKVSDAYRLYGVNEAGNQATYQWSTSADGYSIARRGANGILAVGTPTAGGHAANKTYVDGLIPQVVRL